MKWQQGCTAFGMLLLLRQTTTTQAFHNDGLFVYDTCVRNSNRAHTHQQHDKHAVRAGQWSCPFWSCQLNHRHFLPHGSLAISSHRRLLLWAVSNQKTPSGEPASPFVDNAPSQAPPPPPTNNNNNNSSSSSTNNQKKKKKKPQGVYARPSSAIERGSGFFVPGLEGAKVRLVVGLVLWLLIGMNEVSLSFSSTSTMTTTTTTTTTTSGDYSSLSSLSSPGNALAVGLAMGFALLVLAQAAIEFVKEQRDDLIVAGGGSSGGAPGGTVQKTTTTTTTLQQIWSIPPTDEEYKSKVEWAASSYLSLTPATDLLLLGPGKVVYSLGQDPLPLRSDVEAAACQSALETLSKSTSGRVSLPLTHPTAQAFSASRPTAPRCIVLQRIGKSTDIQLCWMLVSDQILASFTKQDLRWLGRLAVFVEPS